MSAHVNAVASSSKPHKEKKSKKDKSHKHKATTNGVSEVDLNLNPSAKKSKHGSHTHGHKSKHGSKGPFQHQRSEMRLSLAPKYSGDQLVGVRDALDGLVMRYVPQLQGVLLAHWDHTFQDETLAIINECPFGVAEVEFDSIIWAPKLGQKLYGSHSLSSPSHLSLLYNKTFNISIPLQHIPLDRYEFEATDPADEDEDDDDSDLEDDEDSGFGLDGKGIEEVGRWKDKETGKMVGEGGKGIKFTVIGMQVTNNMLSLTGSLLSDPSNPPDISTLPIPTSRSAPARTSPTPEPTPSIHKKARTDRPTSQSASRTNAKSIVTDKTPVAPAPSGLAPPLAPVSQPTASAPSIDPQFLSAREQKKLRKEEEKRKRDARRERKEQNELEGVVSQGGQAEVGMNGTEDEVRVHVKAGGEAEVTIQGQGQSEVQGKEGKSKKRKIEGEEGRKKKKEKRE